MATFRGEELLAAEPLLPLASPPPTEKHKRLSFFEFLELSYGPVELSMMNRRAWAGMFGLILVPYGILSTFMLLFSLSESDQRKEVLSKIAYATLALLFFATPVALFICYERSGPVRYAKRQHRFAKIVFGAASPQVAGALYKLSSVYEYFHDLEPAAQCYQEIIQSLPASMATSWGAPYHCKLGETLYSLGRYHEALEAFETCAILRRKDDSVLHVQSDLHSIGLTHERLGQFEQAIRAYKEAQSALQAHGFGKSVEITASLAHLGSAYVATESYDDAIQVLNQALSVLVVNGDHSAALRLAELHEKLADAYSRKGENRRALEQLILAAKVLRHVGKSDEDRYVQEVIGRISHITALAGDQTCNGAILFLD